MLMILEIFISQILIFLGKTNEVSLPTSFGNTKKKTPTKNELSEILFQLGHENEIEGEIFDLELTPNRGDCLSLLGLARDLNYFFEFKNNLKVYDGQLEDFNFDFINHEPNACPEIKFLYLEIENEVNSYKDYLASYFEDLPNKRVNFFTDVSNYVSYELDNLRIVTISLLSKEL